jgi:hypothetical protein
LTLREPVAKALINEGITLGALGRREEEIAVFEARWRASPPGAAE